VIRIPAGAALAAGVFGADSATMATMAALMGGSLARQPGGQDHDARGHQHLARAVFQRGRQPGGGRASAGRHLAGADAPLVFAAVLLVVVIAMWLVIWALWRFLKGSRLRALFGGSREKSAWRLPVAAAGVQRKPETMFKKILIANRGEIACRVAATARRMGVRTVAVYSDADARAKHVRPATRPCTSAAARPRTAICAGSASWRPPRPRAPRPSTPAMAFSENEDFAKACADAGLVFIGPPPAPSAPWA
jgi:hypothetical protein